MKISKYPIVGNASLQVLNENIYDWLFWSASVTFVKLDRLLRVMFCLGTVPVWWNVSGIWRVRV